MNALNPYEYGMPRDAANFQALSPLGFLERAASVCPEHLALINGDQRQTWGQTYRRCTQLAAALSQRGIGVGDTVALNSTHKCNAHPCINFVRRLPAQAFSRA